MSASLRVASPKTGDHSRLRMDVLSQATQGNGVVGLPELEDRSAEGSSKVQLVTLQNDLVPEELLPPLAVDVYNSGRLGPRHHKHSRAAVRDYRACGIRRPDAVWHHAHVRQKYNHLLDQSTLTDAGRDISFLYDALAAQRKRPQLPPVVDRGNGTHNHSIQKDQRFMDSLFPEEYYVLKNKGLQGLDFFEDKFTIQLQDNEQKLRLFPSLKPSGRLEAVQLMQVLDDLLETAGVKQQCEDETELSQIEHLLELVQTEQSIYNLVFHELIRQVSVDCAERGQLLGKLRCLLSRQCYRSLLIRIPKQLMGLHTDLLAQRALDRKHIEEMAGFKYSIQQLNTELSRVTEDNVFVSKKAETSLQELAEALAQSQKNLDTDQGFYQLYEMQRRRLENHVVQLTEERDLWSRATYSLTLKVIRLNNLELANRLHVSAETWSKTAEHLTLSLTKKDTEDLNLIVQLTDQWKEQLTSLMQQLKMVEQTQCEEICAIQQGIMRWHTFCTAQNRKVPDPKYDKVSEEELHADLQKWSNTLTVRCERYGGEELLAYKETLRTVGKLQENWTETFLRLFRRHPGPDGEPPRGREAMWETANAVSNLHKQLDTRVSGESGIYLQVLSLTTNMELWETKLKSLIGRPDSMHSSDWLKLEKALSSWQDAAEEALQTVASTQPHSEKVKNEAHCSIELEDVFDAVQEFITTQSNFFDCENYRLCEEVRSIHTCLSRWTIDLLVLLVPDHSDDQTSTQSLSPGVYNTLPQVSTETLEKDAQSLAQKLEYISPYITSSCQLIMEEEIQKNKSQDGSDNVVYERNKLQRECGELVDTCRILLSQVKGSCVELAPVATDKVTSQSGSTDSLVDVDVTPDTVEELEGRDESPAPLPEVSRTTSRAEQSGLKDVEEEDDEEEEEEEEGEEESQVISSMKFIGHDGTIKEKTLGDSCVLLSGTEMMVSTPVTDKDHKAFDTLATVVMLQKELQAVEVRAQGVEDRALKAEKDLQVALVKIQELERQLQLQGRPSGEPKVHKKKLEALAPSTTQTTTSTTSTAAAPPKKTTADPKPSSTPRKAKKR